MQYPYDKEVTYGQPNPYDKSLSQGRDAVDNPIVPKDIEHTHWEENEDDIGEAIGTPINFTKSGTGGAVTTVPGAAKGWASWSDDQEIDDEELTKAASSYQNVLPARKNQFFAGAQRMGGREGKQMGTWNKLQEAFVSLRATPEGQMTMSQGVQQAELEAVMTEFEIESKKAQDYIDSVDESDGMRFIFQLDPDHAADALGSGIGKEKIKDTYLSWADRSTNQAPNDAEEPQD
jgi:hypothetical protein